MNNREWLYGLDVADLADWFDAEHDDSVALDAENPTDSFMDSCDYKDGELTIDGAYFADSREKLEADIHRAADEMEEFTYGEKFINTNKILRWLDRQAAITERELCKQCEWPSLAAQPDLESQERIAKLAEQVDELSQQLINARADCEQYRELFSQAITHAHEIVNLQP